MLARIRFPDTTSVLRASIFFFGMTGLAALADANSIELLPGSFFSLSMAATLCVAARLGPGPGIISLVIGRLVLSNRMGTLFPLFVFSIEALFIGVLRRRNPRAAILSLDAVFWPLIGLPLIAVMYRLVFGVSGETTLITVCKVWLMGLFCAQIAGIVADSRLVQRFLRVSSTIRCGFSDFFKDRLSLSLLPVSLIGLLVVVFAIRAGEEERLYFRLQVGIERVRMFASFVGDEVPFDGILASLNTLSLDPEGRYELVEKSSSISASETRPWRAGAFISTPLVGPHPIDRWRAATFFAETEFHGIPIRYSVAFESSFLNVYRSCVASLAISLVLLYSVYGLLTLGARSVARRTRSLIDVAGHLPEEIEKGEEPVWPQTDIEELDTISDEFKAIAHRLRAAFDELTASRDTLESTVKERTRELASLSEDIRLLLARVVNERETERMRVGRELHDEFGQGISGLGMALHSLERRLGTLDERGREKFADMRAAISDLSEGMRRLIADLRPSVLDRLGLSEALERLAAERSDQESAIVEYSSSLPADFSPSEEVKTAVYRIAQEAVRNAIKYSFSKAIRLHLESDTERVSLEVADSGVGFDMDSVKGGEDRTSFGIIGMRERCRALGGEFQVASVPGSGTVVRAMFPHGKKEA